MLVVFSDTVRIRTPNDHDRRIMAVSYRRRYSCYAAILDKPTRGYCTDKMRADISTSVALLLLVATLTLVRAQHYEEEDNLESVRQLHAEQARTHRKNVFNRIKRTSVMAGLKRQMTERFQTTKDRALETAGEGEHAMSPQLRGAIEAGSLEKALNNMLNDPRGLMDSTTSFPECVDQTPADCIALINDEIANDPEASALFPNGVTFDVRKKREPTDDNYNMVVIRLHQDNTVKGK